MRVRILLAEHQALFRSGLRTLLDRQPDMVVVGEAGSATGALRLARAQEADVLVLDSDMQELFGLRAAEEVLRDRPELAVVVLATCDDLSCVNELMAPGILGYVLKKSPEDELLKAVRMASKGRAYIDPEVTRAPAQSNERESIGKTARDRLARLTARECEICRLLAYGYTNVEVGKRLEISNRTVESHRTKIMSKLKLKKRVELVRFAIEAGLLTIDATPKADDLS